MSSRLIRATVTAVVAGVCAAGLLTGCAPEPHETPTPTPHFTSEAQAFQAAEETYRAYVDALNNVDLADPSTFEDVYKWETGDALDSEKKSLTQMHAEGWTVSGESRLALFEPATKSSTEMQRAAVCVDVSAVELIDQNGKSAVETDRGNMQIVLVTFAPSTTSTTGWQISFVEGREGDPQCE
nr:hypothetical protein [Microbacterium bovistercoris]